jgi:hypothetical protein
MSQLKALLAISLLAVAQAYAAPKALPKTAAQIIKLSDAKMEFSFSRSGCSIKQGEYVDLSGESYVPVVNFVAVDGEKTTGEWLALCERVLPHGKSSCHFYGNEADDGHACAKFKSFKTVGPKKKNKNPYVEPTRPAKSYAIAIYTDQPEPTKAKEVIKLFESIYPFNRYAIDYKIVSVAPDFLKCKPYAAGSRVVTCITGNVKAQAAENGFDLAFVVKNMDGYGGSGGGWHPQKREIPVITTSTPAMAMLHEYLHFIGLDDEYVHPTADEAESYCFSVGGENSRMASFVLPNNSDLDPALSYNEQVRFVPWSSLIKDSTFAAMSDIRDYKNNSSAGSGARTKSKYPVNFSDEPTRAITPIGLYLSSACLRSARGTAYWIPSAEISIMEDTSAGLGPAIEYLVERLLQLEGVRFKSASK